MGVAFRTLDDIERRLTELERLVKHLYEHLGLEVPEPPEPKASPEVMTLLAEGKKIEAITQLREETGFSLADAKRVVDELEGPAAQA